MSYCRFGRDSDVYMYPSALGGITCCSCKLSPVADDWRRDSQLFSYEDALAHLQEHLKAGHLVPQCAIDRLKEEIEGSDTP